MSLSQIKVSEIAAGQGATASIDGRPVAVYNSGEGLVVLENVCTHMGCETGWNSLEQTWDCPCHGSRYHPDGAVLRGPAQAPLPRLAHRIENDEIILG